MSSPDVNAIQMSPLEDEEEEVGEPEEENDDDEGGKIPNFFLENYFLFVRPTHTLIRYMTFKEILGLSI